MNLEHSTQELEIARLQPRHLRQDKLDCVALFESCPKTTPHLIDKMTNEWNHGQDILRN